MSSAMVSVGEVKHAIKSWGDRHAPELMEWILAIRILRMQDQLYGDLRRRAFQQLFGSGQAMVLSGPFAGMAYLNETVWGSIVPRWIGSYEEELHGIMRALPSKGYERVIDVGSAEGYYAVGIARLLRRAQIFAFDSSPLARRQLQRMVAMNAVTNLTIGAHCSHETIDELALGRSLIVCDIEGFELELLNPERAVRLRRCDLLVEVHPFGKHSQDRLQEVLTQRFAATHHVEVYKHRPRQLEHYRGIVGRAMDDAALEQALSEFRPPNQNWLWMRSHTIS